MDNRGNNRDSDRGGPDNRRGGNDRGGDRDGSDNRRGGSDRGGDRDRDDRDQRRTDEEETSSYRSQIAPRSTNITNRVVPSTNNIVMERFYSYGIGAGVPLKPGGKSAAVVAIQ